MPTQLEKLTGIGTKGEGLILVKVSISSDARRWGEGVGQSSTGAIKGVIITMC